jgi:Chaperone of endosialidase
MPTLFKPPTPVALSSIGGSGGSSITNNSSSVTINNDSSGNSNVQIYTNNTVAMTVDNNQDITFGGTSGSSNSRMTIIDPDGECLTLINSTTQTYTSFRANGGGGLTITTSNSSVQFGTNSLYIQPNALYIGQTAVSSSATQLNYTNTTPGVAVQLKALVVDTNRDITNINSLSASQLTGTLLTGPQPNITSLSNINITTALSLKGSLVQSTAAELNYLYTTIPGQATAMKAFVFDSTKNLSGVNNVQAVSLEGTLLTQSQPNITSVGTLANLNVNGRIGIGTTTPSKPLEIINPSPTIRLSNNTAAAEITVDSSNNLHIIPDNKLIIKGNVELENATLSGITTLTASSLNGTILTSAQPNITQIGTLSNLNVSDDVVIGTLNSPSVSHRLIINEQYGSLIEIRRSSDMKTTFDMNSYGDLTIAPTRDVILPAALRMGGPITGITDLTASTLTGTLLTPAQPNITQIGTLSNLTVSNAITASAITASSLTGTLLTAAQPNITQIGTLSNLTVLHTITVDAIDANTLDGTLLTPEQPNITQIGTLLSLNVVNTINASSLIASTLTGTLLTPHQPNIVEIGTLSSLSVSHGILAESIVVDNMTGTLLTAAQPNITQIGTLSNLTVSNSIATNALTSSTLTGTLLTAAQPNITQIGTLTNLLVTNSIATSSLTTTTMTGTILTNYQPNITTVGTLTQLSTSSAIGIGVSNPSAAIDINTTGLNTSAAIKLNDGTNSAIISLSENGILLNSNGPLLTIGSGATIQMTGGTIAGLNALTVNQLTGTLMTSNQPNIQRLGTLDYLDTQFIGVGVSHLSNYRVNIYEQHGWLARFDDGVNTLNLETFNSDFVFKASNGRVALYTNNNLVLNGGTIIGLDTLTVNQMTGTIMTAAQPNITQVGTLSSLSVAGGATVSSLTSSGPISAPSISIDTATLTGSLSVAQGITLGTTLKIGNTTLNEASLISMMNPQSTGISGGDAGVVVANLALIPDANKNLSSFNNLTATNFYGTLRTAYQPYITTVGNLTDLNVAGYLGIGTTAPMKQVEINSTTGDCLRLSFNKSATSARADFTVDASGNLTIAPSGLLKLNSVVIGSTPNASAPLELGYTTFGITQAYSYRTNIGGMGVINATTTPTSYNYSIRACGRILCSGSIDVMSDRRTKKNIRELTDEYCKSFVERTTPVSFNRINGDPNKAFGYIAQELMRSGFPELVNIMPDPSMKEEIDEDGFISPEGAAYNVSYEHIIPILAKNQQRLMKENAELKAKLDAILDMLSNQS